MSNQIGTKKIIIISLLIFTLVLFTGVAIIILTNNSQVKEESFDTPSKNTGTGGGETVVSYSKEDKVKDLEKFNVKSFENYIDWKEYKIGTNIYTPYYTDTPLHNINTVLESRQQAKRIELTGVISDQDRSLLMAIVKMIEDSPFQVIRVYNSEGDGVSKFEDKWIALPMSLINTDSKSLPKGVRTDNSIFAKNNGNGTWTATYNGSADNDEIVDSVPDQFFVTPFSKSNFYNY